MGSRGYELRPRLQGIYESGAGCGKVEAPDILRSQLVLHQAGRGGKQHVGSYGGDKDGVDVRGGDAPFCKSGLGSFHGQIAAGHSLFDDVALADTGAFDDPLVRGFYHLFQIFVGEQARRDVGSQGADFGA